MVDVAQGGQDARRIADPNADYWRVALQRLDNAGVSAQQVQVAWLKQAVARPTQPFPDHAQELQALEATIVQILKQKFPNIRICYLSSRIYAGYATSSLNPEPFAYEYGFSQQWLIQQQISGDAALNYDASKGPVVAPWLAWGPYLWADGTVARSDDLTWVCSDFAADGTHPSSTGRQKVADLLDQHFTTDPTATPWYIGVGGGDRSAALPYGSPNCSGSLGTIMVRNNSMPWIGNPSFAQGITHAAPDSPAVLFWSRAPAAIPVDGCLLLVDPVQIWRAESLVTNMSGRVVLNLQIPNDNNLIGLSLFTQWLVLDPLASGLQNLIGGGTLSQGMELRLGTQ